MAFLGYQDTVIPTGPYGYSGYSIASPPPLVVTEREQRLLRGMTPAQVELVGELKSQAAAAEQEKHLERRKAMAKGQEALETVGTAAGLGFVRGYYPNWKPLGFNPSLLAGVAAHGTAMYVAEEAHAKRDGDALKYEGTLEHMGNGALSAYAFEEMSDVARRLRATQAAKGAAVTA